jgi:1,4-alpha-glucan branching enzyme
VHGKGSILGRMPGDQWQRFANMRAYYTFMYGHPGKKLMFMGNEIAQSAEWSHDHSLDWHLLQYEEHRGIQTLVRDLNHIYRETPALHELDCEGHGFEWLVIDDTENSVFAWLRRGRDTGQMCVAVINFTPQVRYGYKIKVPAAGLWREIFNSDSARYGGTNVGNAGRVEAVATGAGGELTLTLPPLAGIFLAPGR